MTGLSLVKRPGQKYVRFLTGRWREATIVYSMGLKNYPLAVYFAV